MNTFVLFGILSIPVIVISWPALKNMRGHGFYRFFSWECIIWLFASNYRFWFKHVLSIHQLFSWLLLIISAVVVIAGVVKMKSARKAERQNDAGAVYSFEKTGELIDSGIFRYIRHPLYASLLYLTWGIWFKNPTIFLFIISVLSSVFLYVTARLDEKECIGYFGEEYRNYMRRSKMFIPYLF